MPSPLIALEMSLLSFSMDPSPEGRARLDASLDDMRFMEDLPSEQERAAYQFLFCLGRMLALSHHNTSEEARDLARHGLDQALRFTRADGDREVVEELYGGEPPWWVEGEAR